MPAFDGSSPRMRGKPIVSIALLVMARIIPAHAGQTGLSSRWFLWRTDHPRACGANWSIIITSGRSSGSSPRMRGKLVIGDLFEKLQRIIPAHAGQTTTASPPATPCTDHPRACGANGKCHPPPGPPDHPRACGANSANWTSTTGPDGSSPRMRGKPSAPFAAQQAVRIIPAHAGQTSWCWRTRRPGSDHPRACGANDAKEPFDVVEDGSSPRMRGKLPWRPRQDSRIRIIPAHAGQTPMRHLLAFLVSDHPRACGANGINVNGAFYDGGSSPRMRGKLHTVRQGRRLGRIIPAHAGQTPFHAVHVRGPADHPRACGANSAASCQTCVPAGSSPRMRGKQDAGGHHREPRRIIPAHAGQTICWRP
ncbi:hypothetical protein PG22506_1228 [Bifidobacterium pseudolongum subsp. globosum]|nr:hypothetical protein PG22506_1228 [Bifidobacterium pseudolongum subsp. globosum]